MLFVPEGLGLGLVVSCEPYGYRIACSCWWVSRVCTTMNAGSSSLFDKSGGGWVKPSVSRGKSFKGNVVCAEASSLFQVFEAGDVAWCDGQRQGRQPFVCVQRRPPDFLLQAPEEVGIGP